MSGSLRKYLSNHERLARARSSFDALRTSGGQMRVNFLM